MRQCGISRIGKFICHSGINTVTWRKAGTITAVLLIEDLRTKKDLFILVSLDGGYQYANETNDGVVHG